MPPMVMEPEERPRRRKTILACGAVALAAAGTLVMLKVLAPSPNMQAFQQFWNPVFRVPEPLLVPVAGDLGLDRGKWR